MAPNTLSTSKNKLTARPLNRGRAVRMFDMSETQDKTLVEEAPFYIDGRNHCEGCSDSPWPGIRAPANPDVAEKHQLKEGEVIVERCDTCQIYQDDEAAAMSVFTNVYKAKINGFNLTVANTPTGEATYYFGLMRGPFGDPKKRIYHIHNTAAMNPMLEGIGLMKADDPVTALFKFFKKRESKQYPLRLSIARSEHLDRVMWSTTCYYP